MLKFIIKRVLFLVPIMLGVMVIVFIIRAITPGNPVDQLLSEDATPEQRQELTEELGLDQPLPVQFVRYVGDAVTGDLGTSYTTKQPVLDELLTRLPISLTVCFGAVLIGVLFGVPLGTLSAVKQYSWADSIVRVLSMVFAATPQFCLGLVLIMIFSVQLHWLPSVGLSGPASFILPMATIGLTSLAQYTRITRSSMLEVIRQDYIRTTRAKGQTELVITTRHALRNAFIPIMAQIGNQIGHQLGGALIVETVFGMPGIGKYIGDAITARNFPAIQGGVLFLAFIFTIVNLLVDLSFTFINPRLRSSILNARPGRLEKWWKNRRSKAARAA